MTKNKNLFKNISILFCLVPMLLLSLFISFPSKKLTVSAGTVETVYDFVGSNFTSYCHVRSTNNSLPYDDLSGYSVLSMQITLRKSSSTGMWVTPFAYFERYGLSFSSSAFIDSLVLNTDSKWYSARAFLYQGNDVSKTNYVNFYYFCDADFSCNVKTVTFGSSNSRQYSLPDTETQKYNFVCYTDVNNFSFYFLWEVPNESLPSMLYNERIYYLNNPSNFTDNETYNFGYGAGYQDGYNTGNYDGNSSGYKDGYNAGNTNGYYNGYSDGVNSANTYTFTGLIGAVIDAPVSAFTSLLNFEILGVNILGFISGLLTLALIIFIIKLCMGGK